MKFNYVALQPREKYDQFGKAELSNHDLLAIILGTGSANLSVFELSKQILSQHTIQELPSLNQEQWMKFEGIGKVKATILSCIFELVKRSKTVNVHKINKSIDAYHLLSPHLSTLLHEEFWCVFLNHQNSVLDYKLISKGGIDNVLVDHRLIFQRALALNATKIILAHNHPSQQLKASQADIKLTQRIKKAGELLNIKLIDHIIIAGEDYLSIG